MKFTLQHLVLAASCAWLLTACGQAVDAIQMPSSAKPAAGNVSDRAVTDRVNAALAGEHSLQGQNIAVVTTKGDVRLTGEVSSGAQIDTAIQLARAVEGAHAIHDELTVRPSSSPGRESRTD